MLWGLLTGDWSLLPVSLVSILIVVAVQSAREARKREREEFEGKKPLTEFNPVTKKWRRLR